MELAAGEAVLFWSSDGSGVFYEGEDGFVHRFDLSSKLSNPVANSENINVLGKVPGIDAVFVRISGTNSVSIKSLSNASVGPDLNAAAARIPLRDADGRWLNAITGAGPDSLLLNYSSVLTPKGSSRNNRQIVKFQ